MAKSLSFSAVSKAVGMALESAQKDGGLPVSIAVTDGHGELVYFARMDGTPERSIPIAINKAYTAAKMHRHTHQFNEMIRDRHRDISWFGDPRFTALGGGAVLFKDGTKECIGGIGVSGRTSEKDFEIAEIVVKNL
jgi:uncharacterized protein GlcG (DUF336 family)